MAVDYNVPIRTPADRTRIPHGMADIMRYFFSRVLRRAFNNGRSSGADQMIALLLFLALTVLNVALYRPVDWSTIRWQPIIWTYGGFFAGLFVWHYLRAQWETHKEDAAIIVGLEEKVEKVALERSLRSKAQSLSKVIIELYNDFRAIKEQWDRAEESLARSNNTVPDVLRRPLGYNTLPFPDGVCKSGKPHWAVLFGFQQRYQTYIRIWNDMALVLEKAAPPTPFPCETDYEDIKDNLKQHMEALLAYGTTASGDNT